MLLWQRKSQDILNYRFLLVKQHQHHQLVLLWVSTVLISVSYTHLDVYKRQVHIVAGEVSNMKITTAADYKIAQVMAENGELDTKSW